MVAICTERTVLGPCLDAVAAQARRVVVVVAGDGRAPAPLPAGVEIVRSAPGIAQARNAALAVCDDPVLAFLDDDVVVEEGWGDALAAAWAAAPDDVAVIGGPVAVRVAGDRYSPALAAHVAGLDLGAAERDVDVRERTLVGGNLSFRADALRGIGGFWPMRGRPGARDWFTEEHHAQRELAAAGWRVRYAPRAAAVRIVGDDPRELVRGRLLYGARRALQGGPGAGHHAARRSAGAAARAVAALGAGDAPRAAERALGALEHGGAVLGAWLAHDDFQPAGPTPFRASVPPPQPGPAARAARRARRRLGRREPAVPILLYHRIADLPADGLGLAVHRAHFTEHLEILARDWCPLGLDELVERQRSGDLPARAVAITFDDGYVDNLTDAVPALRAAGLAATVFVATGAVPAGGPFFWDEAARLVEAAAPHGTLALELEGQRRAWRLGTPAQRRVATRHLHQWLQSLRPESVAAALAELRDSAVEEPLLDARAVTVDELRRLDEAVVIGAHTRRHPRLAALAPDEQRAEIEGSRDDLAAWLDRRPAGFAYPFGVPGFDFDATTVELVRAAGFRYAVANASGPVTAASDPLALPRVIAPDVAGAEFAGWLERQVVVA